MLHELLRLTRPLVVLDVESTSAQPETARVCQIALHIFWPDREPKAWSSLVNPGIPIPAASTEVHGITDEMVKDSPKFQDLSKNLYGGLSGADIAGYNVFFDIRVLAQEFKRCGLTFDPPSVIDPFRLWQILHPRSLTDAVKYWTGKELEGAHEAGADVAATVAVLAAQLTKHPELPRDPAALADVCFPKDRTWVDRRGKIRWVDGKAVLAIGKYRDRPLEDIVATDRGYFVWMLDPKQDFSAEVKGIISEALEGRFPAKEAA